MKGAINCFLEHYPMAGNPPELPPLTAYPHMEPALELRRMLLDLKIHEASIDRWGCITWRGVRISNNATTVVCDHYALNVYSDHSGPTLRVYVGPDLAQDREKMLRNNWVNTKLNREARLTLLYKGSDEKKSHVRYGGSYYDPSHYNESRQKWQNQGIAKYLLTDDDLGREFCPRGDEPRVYHTREICLEIARILEQYQTYLTASALTV